MSPKIRTMIAPVSDAQEAREAIGLITGQRRWLAGIIALTRWNEHALFVTVTTLLGVQFAGAALDMRLPLVLVANWLAVSFAFMINDIEDAPDDALNPAKRTRNPVAAGILSPLHGYTASWIVAAAAASLYSFLNVAAFRLGIACLALGVLYSWRPVRLKSIPVMDLLSHSLLLAGFQLLSAYFAFVPGGAVGRWLPPLVFVTAISVYGQLFNEVRDLDFDREARLTHTAAVFGRRIAQILMACALMAAGAAVVYAMLFDLVPWWTLFLAVLLGGVLLGQLLLETRRREPLTAGGFHNPALAIGVLAIVVWMAVDGA